MGKPDRQDSHALYEEGLEALHEQRYDDALRLADRLEDRRYSGAFEVRALVLDRQGDTEAAVVCLEQGVDHAPQAWLLWQLLGNYRSDLQRHDEAEEGDRHPDVPRGVCHRGVRHAYEREE